MGLTSGHHATPQTFKHGVGGSGFVYRSRNCIECGMVQRRLFRGMCEACYKRVRYHTDLVYRQKELERGKRIRKKAKRKKRTKGS